uniref:Uncharacterized protein n=1 Tax=Meloidogyne enterolobii TaxID=390850 RepID=A0A6V7VUC7_MELEN|nr:unnamed protein product [Meloidogyne enterolobii]
MGNLIATTGFSNDFQRWKYYCPNYRAACLMKRDLDFPDFRDFVPENPVHVV